MVETEEECRAATERAELGRPGATDVVLGQGRPGLCVLFFFFFSQRPGQLVRRISIRRKQLKVPRWIPAEAEAENRREYDTSAKRKVEDYYTEFG